MSAKAIVSQADITRVVRGALKAGLPAGSFTVEVGDGIIRLLPVSPAEAVASGSTPAREALARWRKSA